MQSGIKWVRIRTLYLDYKKSTPNWNHSSFALPCSPTAYTQLLISSFMVKRAEPYAANKVKVLNSISLVSRSLFSKPSFLLLSATNEDEFIQSLPLFPSSLSCLQPPEGTAPRSRLGNQQQVTGDRAPSITYRWWHLQVKASTSAGEPNYYPELLGCSAKLILGEQRALDV